MINKIVGFFKKYLRLIIAITMTILILRGMYWMGLKGMFGMFLGMVIMTVIFLSKNPLVLWFIQKFNAETYMNEIKK